MAQNGRELVKAFAQAIGLDPKIVKSLRLEAEARTAILVATVEIYPEMTPEQQAEFMAALDANGKQFSVLIVPCDLDGG